VLARGELRNYCDAQGTIPPPTSILSRIEELTAFEDSATTIEDVLSIVDGLREAHGLANTEDGREAGMDLLVRMFAPILLVSLKRDPRLASSVSGGRCDFRL
jgi:hypothetical protein